jgi:hypothetical protein
MNPAQKARTVFNATVTVALVDGTEQEWTVRQVQLGEYQKAFPLIDDEFALVALCTGRSKEAILANLTPESYETAASLVREVNRSFFAYASRRVTNHLRMMGVPEAGSATPSPTSSGTS